MTSHLEEKLRQDIDRIRGKITEMSALAEEALANCLRALEGKDRQSAYVVILRDQYIDELEKQIDRLCLEFLVRQQPAAQNLRFAYAAIKINLELERVGDYAESIARQSLKLMPLDIPLPLDKLRAIAGLSIPMLHDAIQAFVNQDAELARKTIATEDAVDGLKRQLNGELVRLFQTQQIPFEALNPLLMISRRFERVSDQARNICMEVLYMCTGEYAKHAGTDLFRILFVDQHNSCRSQMAEAIANSLGLDRFIFASAGLEPRPVDAGTIAFMREKGLDVSRMVPKAVSQVPHLDHFQVIVTLDPEARRAFPTKPRKVVFLDWSIADPSALAGEAARAAYEQTYQFLTEHLRDLTGALAGKAKP